MAWLIPLPLDRPSPFFIRYTPYRRLLRSAAAAFTARRHRRRSAIPAPQQVLPEVGWGGVTWHQQRWMQGLALQSVMFVLQ
jgi:hypothetical protein